MALEAWEHGAAYESYVGRWSRRVAAEYLAWLDEPADLAWLDAGCGTGALSQAVLSQCRPARVVGIDRSEGFARTARTTTADNRATFAVCDAASIPVEAAGFDACVSGLMLNFAPDPGRVVGELRRVVKPGGTVSVYLWDYAGRMDFMRVFWDAAAQLRPEAAALDEGRRFPLCQSDALGRLFNDGGLSDVRVRPIDIDTTFRDFEDYWTPFLGGQGPAPAYVASLDDTDRLELRDRIRRLLSPVDREPIHMVARAWAVRGTA